MTKAEEIKILNDIKAHFSIGAHADNFMCNIMSSKLKLSSTIITTILTRLYNCEKRNGFKTPSLRDKLPNPRKSYMKQYPWFDSRDTEGRAQLINNRLKELRA